MASVMEANSFLGNIDSKISISESSVWYGSCATTVVQQISALSGVDRNAGLASVLNIEGQLQKLEEILALKPNYESELNNYVYSCAHYNDLVTRRNNGDESVTSHVLSQAKINVETKRNALREIEKKINNSINGIKILSGYLSRSTSGELDIYKIDLSNIEAEIITNGFKKAINILDSARTNILSSAYDSCQITSKTSMVPGSSVHERVSRTFNIGVARDKISNNIKTAISMFETTISKIQTHVTNITSFENGEGVEIPLEMNNDISPETSAPATPEQEMYNVKKGDTLSAIAASYGISHHALYEANKEKIPNGDPRRLQVGTNLVIPGVTTSSTTTAATSPSVEIIGTEKLEASSEIPEIAPLRSFEDVSKTNWAVDCENMVDGEYSTPFNVATEGKNAGKMVDKNGRKMSITSPLGDRINPLTDKSEFHQGTDFSAGYNDKGTNISSIGSGIVIAAPNSGHNSGYGSYVRVLHQIEDEQGNVSYAVSTYSHLEDVKVEVGDIVDENAIVGTMGNSGNVTGDHLHLELVEVPLTVEEVEGKTVDEIISITEEKGITTETRFENDKYYNMGEYYKNKNLL